MDDGERMVKVNNYSWWKLTEIVGEGFNSGKLQEQRTESSCCIQIKCMFFVVVQKYAVLINV